MGCELLARSWNRAALSARQSISTYLRLPNIDLLSVVVLLVVIAATIATVVSGFNVFLFSEAKIALVDYIRLAQCDPLGDGLWAPAMLFSTLVPTGFHFGIAVVGVSGSIVSDRWKATTIATLSEEDPLRAILLWAYLCEFSGRLGVNCVSSLRHHVRVDSRCRSDREGGVMGGRSVYVLNLAPIPI